MSLPEFCERRARVFASRNEFGRALFYTAAALRAQHSPLPTWQTVIAHAFAEAYR